MIRWDALKRTDSPIWGNGITTSLWIGGDTAEEVVERAKERVKDHPIEGCHRAAELFFQVLEKQGVPTPGASLGSYESDRREDGGDGQVVAQLEVPADYWDSSYYTASLFAVKTATGIVWHFTLRNPRQNGGVDFFLADRSREIKAMLA